MKRKLLSMILAAALAVNLAVSVSAGDIDVMLSDDTVNGNAVSEDSDPGITFDGEASAEDGAAGAEVEVEENADEEADSEDEDTVEGDFSDSEVDVFSDGALEAGASGHAVVGGYIPSDLDYNTPVYNGNDGARAVGVPAAYRSDVVALKTNYPTVRNQGSYGTCWAFSTMGLAEFDLINKRIFTNADDLSELQLAYFTYNFVQDPLGGTAGDTAHYYNENTRTNYLNYGGNYEMAVRRLGQWIGAVNESDVPYGNAQNVLDKGLDDSYAYGKDVAHLENAYLVNIKRNPTDVKKQIIEHGAVGTMYTNYYAGMTYGDGYNAYFDTKNTSSGGGSHAVMIVGWDDDFSKDKFLRDEKPSSNGAWLIRNSWGRDFDYFWMSYETNSLADTAWVMDFATANNYDNNYQLDGGWMTYQSKNQNIVSNVFEVGKKANVTSETLKAVSLSFTHKASVSYTIDIYTDLQGYDSPTSGKHQVAATTMGQTSYAGVYTVPLNSEVKLEPGTRFSIVVTMDQDAMDCEEAVSYAEDITSDKYTWKSTVSASTYNSFYKTGESFVVNFRNYCIKAFTTNNAYNTYNITYELDGGENNVNNPTTCGGNDTAIALQAPTKDGCTFDGWYSDSEYTNEITEIPAHASQDYTLYAKWSSALGDSAYGYTLNLDGNIAFNMYMDLPDELKNKSDAYMEFTFPNGSTSRMTVAEARKNGDHYVFSFKVAAKEMTVDVKARMYAGDTYGKEYTVSVQKYAEYILTHPNDYDTLVVSLIKSMLNYGTAAQQLFDYQIDKPANEIMNEGDRAVTDYTTEFENYKYVLNKSATDSGIKWYGSSLILESDTSVRDYFQLESGHSIAEYTFTGIIGDGKISINLKPVESSINGAVYYYVEVPDIKAQNLDQSIKVAVSCTGQSSNVIELQYNAFSYAQVISQNPETYQKTIDVTNAMYEYWKNARAYVNSNNQSNA